MAAITPAGRPFSLHAICEGEREKGRERAATFLRRKEEQTEKVPFQERERGEGGLEVASSPA